MTAIVVGVIGLVFFAFSRRRRREELEPNAAIAAAAAASVATAGAGPSVKAGSKARAKAAPAAGGKGAKAAAAAAAAAVVDAPLPVVPPPPAASRVMAAGAAAEILVEEAGMPRWRRPSVQKARKESRNEEVAHVPVAFTDAEPVGERRLVRYRLVRMSTIPDEIMGDEVARLDRGDEVELIRSAGAYWLVRTPYGEEGWVHQMTLESGPPQPDDVSAGPADDEPPF